MFSDEEIGVFFDELDEKIQVMNDGFLALERDGENPHIIQEIFRAAHTVKGSSAIMGYEQMSKLTHEMENLFDRIRQGEVKITPEMIDALFDGLDTLKALRDQVTGEGMQEGVVDPAIFIRLQGLITGAQDPSGIGPEEPVPGTDWAADTDLPPLPRIVLEATELEIIAEALQMGQNVFRIGIHIDSDCQMRSVRAFLIFQRLEECGEIIQCAPTAEIIQDGKYDAGFEVLIISRDDGDYIKSILMSIAEVVDVTIEPGLAPSAPSSEETPAASPTEQPKTAALQAQDTPLAPFAAPKAKEKETQGPVPAADRKNVKTVRIDVQKLDSLMNLVGELVIERTRLERFASIMGSRLGSDEMADTLNEISNHLGQVTSDLQDEIMKARMLPISQVFNRFPRMVRDLAHKMGKEINLVIEGRDTELDRNVIEVISDPLIHMIRNAIDHGIESREDRLATGKPEAGTLLLRAFHQENHIVIRVQDDGRGLNLERIKAKAIERGLLKADVANRLTDQEIIGFSYMAGFSTAAEVSDLSGRGVGLDVVKTQIEQVNGSVEIGSTPGQGTSCTIKLPLTLAIIKALMVALGDQVYAFPLAHVVETVQISREEIQLLKHSEVVVVRGMVLPLVRLSRIFAQSETNTEKIYVVIVGTSENQVGVIVDRLIGEQEIVIKSLGVHLGRVTGISGATILGDGRVSLIVDVRALASETAGTRAKARAV